LYIGGEVAVENADTIMQRVHSHMPNLSPIYSKQILFENSI